MDDLAPSRQLTVYALFRQAAGLAPHRVAIEWQGRTWTYAEFLASVDSLAADLAARGIRRGDRIAILSENRPGFLRLVMAAAALGAIVACQNTRQRPREMQHCLDLVSPALVLVSERHRPLADTLDLRCVPVGPVEDSPSGDAPQLPAPEGAVEADDPLLLIYTSGTTGLPKAAAVSHAAEIARMAVVRMDLGTRAGDAMLAWAPMYHIGGTDQSLAALMTGGPVVIIDGFDVPALVDALGRHQAGWLLLVPGAIEPLLDALEASPAGVRGVRSVGCMADLVPAALVERTTRVFQAPFLNSFGMTETGLPPLSADLIPVGTQPTVLSKRLNALCEFRLVDPEGREVPPGAVGEGAVRGPTLFNGYWNAPQANAESFAGGYFRMGDLFRQTPDGRYDFVDRARYLIKCGGENIYPAEIERVLLADARVADAVVVRKPDARWGEVPVAFIARHAESLDEAAVEALCRDALAGYKRPRDVRFVAFDDLPRSTSGKILRHEMEKRL